MAAKEQKGVTTLHPQYIKNAPLWKRCNDAAEGEQAIHAAGTEYLPKLAEEADKDYKARKARTPFFNATWRTISGLKGMIFRKDPVGEYPAAIVPYLGDVDMAGTPMDVFAQEIVEDILTPGRCGILVDRPPMPVVDGQTITVAQAELLGLRPTMQKYSAESIRNWKVGRVGNVMMLTMVTLEESEAIEEDEFSHKTEIRYRVLDLFNGDYRQRVFKSNEGTDEQIGGDIFPQMNGKNMNFIPFFFIGVNDLSPDVDSPPLLDLVNMNIHHYQVSADFEHGCHYSGLPTLFITGYRPDEDDKPIYIGGPSANCLPDPGSQAYFAEVEGNFGALQTNLDSKKAEMAVLGARMLESQKTAVESAETQRQRVAGEQSQLGAMAKVISMGLTKALRVFADWAGASGKVDYQLNTDFIPAGMTPEELTALVSSWQSGAISGQVLFDNLQRGEVIASDVTFEEEQERIKSQRPPAPELM